MELSTPQRVSLLVLFFIGLLLELGLQTFWMGKLGPYLSPVVWLLAGIVSCGSALLLVGFKKSPLPVSRDYYQRYNNALLILSVSLFSALTIAAFLSNIFQKYPSDPMSSDILPSLEFYVRRFVGGERVYQAMPFPGWTVLPTYFPLLWMPYLFSEILQIDYRWTAYLVFVIGIYLYNLKIVRYDSPYAETAIKALLPFLFLLAFIPHQEHVFGYAVELLPVGFYLILTLSIFNRSRLLMAVGILLCLLSRYAFTFWLPFYFLVIWMEWGFKDLLRVGLMVLAGVLAFYILPFWIKDPSILKNGLDYYAETAVGQWQPQSWQEAGDKPHHLNRGMSFAIYFYDFAGGSLEDKLAANRLVHLLACALAAGMILLAYLLLRKRGLNVKIYLLVSLKFYLLIFYGLFYVPFGYLYMLPLFLSFPLLYYLPFRRGRYLALSNN